MSIHKVSKIVTEFAADFAIEISLIPEKLKYCFAHHAKDTEAQEKLLGQILTRRIEGYASRFLTAAQGENNGPKTDSKKFPVIAYEGILTWVGRGGRELPDGVKKAVDSGIEHIGQKFNDQGLSIKYSVNEGLQCSAGSLPINLSVSFGVAPS